MFTLKHANIHVHNYAHVSFIHERGTALDSRFIDRIIVIRKCNCGASVGIDCGDKESMRKLWVTLKE